MPNLHQCSICKKVDFWSDAWTNYSNILVDDYDSRLSIRTCSDACFAEAKRRIKSGKIVLPKVGMRGYQIKLIRKNKGYGRQPEQVDLIPLFHAQPGCENRRSQDAATWGVL